MLPWLETQEVADFIMRVAEAGHGVEALEPQHGARALLDSPMILPALLHNYGKV
jgi:hypothetical protein